MFSQSTLNIFIHIVVRYFEDLRDAMICQTEISSYQYTFTEITLRCKNLSQSSNQLLAVGASSLSSLPLPLQLLLPKISML